MTDFLFHNFFNSNMRLLTCRYHSESGWQTLLEIIVEHYGLEVDQSAITIFICLVPVIIDACVKLWVCSGLDYFYTNLFFMSSLAMQKCHFNFPAYCSFLVTMLHSIVIGLNSSLIKTLNTVRFFLFMLVSALANLTWQAGDIVKGAE